MWKIIVQNESSVPEVPECILQDPVNPLFPFLMKELAIGAKVGTILWISIIICQNGYWMFI